MVLSYTICTLGYYTAIITHTSLNPFPCRDSQCVLQCPADCNGNGLCVSPNNCSCNLGYTGEYCSLECYCNGHSDCLDATESGRRICLECKHNTQVHTSSHYVKCLSRTGSMENVHRGTCTLCAMHYRLQGWMYALNRVS